MPSRFRFRSIPFIAALAVAAAGIALGQWQTRRALEKEGIEAKLVERSSAPSLQLTSALQTVDEIEYRRITVRGQFLGGWNIYLDNRPYQGRAGFYLLTPLKIEGSDLYLLVARGWLPRDPIDRSKLPQIATPAGTVQVAGIARRNVGHVMELGQASALRPDAIVQNLEPADLARAAGIRLQPFIIEQTDRMQDGLVRDWPRPSSGADRHRGYAFQWYALAVLALVFFIVTGFRRGTK
jgi:surfeit locus 1 family protein